MTKRILIFGATGTVGSGALLECLDHPEITEVICVLRRSSGHTHPKLREILHSDFDDFSAIERKFAGIDACFWALGSPSSGHTVEEFTRIEHGFVSAAVKALYDESRQCRFVFVSGPSADRSEMSRQLWARIKGRAENTVLRTGFRQVVVFQPGAIAARRGLRHSVPLYGLVAKLAPLMRPFGMGTSTQEIGRAFVAVALGRAPVDPQGAPLNSAAINALACLAM